MSSCAHIDLSLVSKVQPQRRHVHTGDLRPWLRKRDAVVVRLAQADACSVFGGRKRAVLLQNMKDLNQRVGVQLVVIRVT